MAKQFGKKWTKNEIAKSITLFLLHIVLLVGIIAVFLLGDKLSYLGEYMKMHGINYVFGLFCVLMLTFITYLYFLFENRKMLESGKNITLLFFALDLYFIFSWLIGEKIDIFARPVAFLALMICVLVGKKDAIYMNIVAALLMFIVDTFSGSSTTESEYYSSLIISFSAGMVAIFSSRLAKTRFRVVLVGVLTVLPIDLTILVLGIPSAIGNTAVEGLPAFQGIFLRMGYGWFGGLSSAVLFLTILPLFEVIFNCLTTFRLRELTSSDAKVLKKLKREAPGTYNHSMMVAQLAETSAAAIGENVDYARAAALYHDVGKLHYPEHFTENQGDYNLHDELAPELSADIIRSHVKDGYALIRANHLPEFFADVAIQHHGTMPIRYFYAKALKLTDGELNIEDFSYLGPKPQTKIAAIIMIADASEAAVRAVGARTAEAVEKAVRAVIEERMDFEQFAECDITMADLTKIRQALVSAFMGASHHRIKYPSIKYKRTESGTKGENV